MAGHISEEDLLSGIELLPTTEPTTPSNLATAPHKEESSILEDSISSMKGASSHQSPDKLPSSYFTTSVHEVQKKLRDSLASSLRREAEMKSSWLESPGEVRVTSEVEKHNGHSSPMKLDTPIKVHVDDTATTLQSKLQLLSPSEHVGPNICLSSQFPSGISPIKTGGGENLKSPFSENTNPQSNEDVNTQQLLTFIKNLEKGPKSDQTVASQLSQLSVLLKQSTDLQPRVSEYNPTKKIVLKSPSKPEMKSTVDMVFKSNKFRSDSSKSSTSNRDKTNRKKKSTAVLDQDKHVSLLKPKVPTGKSVQFFQQESKPNSKKIKKRVNNSEETSKSEISCRSVNDMLVVRNHLQTMLNLRKVDAQALDPPAPDLYNNTDDSKNEDTFRSTDTATLLRTHPSDLVPSFTSDNGEISAEMTDSLTSDVFSMLKTNKQRSTRSSVDSSISAENGILRDTLEKEKYRRQHCEKQIQKLQKKMLEIQQELAVAHSVDKKKDLMIEQLDKTLAKVVEGWKSHESNLVKSVEKLTREGESWKEESVKLKEMVVGLENELAKSLEELVNAKETIVRLQEGENRSKKTYQKRTEEINKVIDQKNEQMSNLETQNEDLHQRLEKLGKQIKEQSSRFESEKKEFLEKDTVWEETVFELEKKHEREINIEKKKVENEVKKNEDFKKTLSSTEEEMRRLGELLDIQRTEMESMKTSSAITEAKHSALIKKLKAESEIYTERKVTEKLAHLHQDAERNENLLRETHKKQVLELVESQRKELHAQSERYEEELQKRVAMMKKALAENEIAQNLKLQEKMELIRKQMFGKMQNMLQAHYNETIEVVGDVPFHPHVGVKTSNADAQRNIQLVPHTMALESIMTSQPHQTNNQSAFNQVSQCVPPSSNRHSNQAINQQSSDNLFNPVKQVSLEITEEPLTNLSLLSDISTTASYRSNPPPPTFPNHLQQPSKTLQTTISHAMVQPTSMQNQSNCTMETTKHENSIKIDDIVRQKQLHHYVQMLLQRPPSDPVTPNDFITHYKEDNKENGATEQPMFGQPDFIYKTTGKQTSPDLVPVKQNKMHPVTTGAITCVPPSFSTTNTKSTTRAKPVVRFAPTDRKTTQAVTMATPLPQLNTQSQSMFSPAQMSEITQLLGLYSSATTPTGETKVAADNLLRYLKGANAPFDDKASFQPSIASSPLKQPTEKVPGDSSFLNSSATSVGKRRLNSKSFPAWR